MAAVEGVTLEVHDNGIDTQEFPAKSLGQDVSTPIKSFANQRGHFPDHDEARYSKPCMKSVLRAFAEHAPNYVLLPSILPILEKLCTLQQGLHNSSGVPKSILLTGPRGIGKTCLFETAAKQPILEAMLEDFPSFSSEKTAQHAELKSLTFFSSIDLSVHTKDSMTTFYEWVLDEIVEFLRHHADRLNTARVLKCICDQLAASRAIRETCSLGSMRDALEQLPASQERNVALNNLGGGFSVLPMVSACLKNAKVAALFLVDEAECLFKESHFTDTVAASWKAQMLGTLFANSAIGVVVCASFQRASQLFLTKSGEHDFPDEYTHMSLRADWNDDKLEHVRMHQPEWTRELLTRYLWAESCRVLGSKADDVLEKEAARLDAVFIRGECLTQQDVDGALDASLEHLLSAYGHTPRKVTRFVEETLKKMQPPCCWPEPTIDPLDKEEEEHDEKESVAQRQAAARCLDMFMRLLGKNINGVPHLGFCPKDYGVRRRQLHLALVEADSGDSAPVTSVGSAVLDAKQNAEKRAVRCIDAAIDCCMLVLVDKRTVAIADPSVNVRRICADSVSPVAVSWLRHKGYGEEAEILIARNLAREGSCLLLDSSSVLSIGRDGSVAVANDDSTAPPMAQVHLVALSPDGTPLTALSVRLDDLEQYFGDVGKSVLEGHMASLAARKKLKALEKLDKPDSAAVAAAEMEVQKNPVKTTWELLQKAGRAHGMNDESLAAFLSVCRTQPSVRKAIVRRQKVWVKEAPDAMGGDLLCIYMGLPVEGVIPVHTIRVQAKVATQESLNSPSSTAGTDRTHEALQGLLDPSLSAAKQQKRHLKVRHQPTVRAVEGFMRGVLHCLRAKKPDPSTWHGEYMGKAQVYSFKHRDPYIATTHTVPDRVKARCRKAGVVVLDAQELSGAWGPLGDVCRTLDLLPFAERACGAAAGAGGGSDPLQEALDRAMALPPAEEHP